jgi:hypothetical protein
MGDNISLVETSEIEEKVQKILRQTDYTDEQAREKLKENNFDIVYGTVRDYTVDPPNLDFTQYTMVYDLTKLTVHYRTYADQQIKKLGTLQPAFDVQLYPFYRPYLQPIPNLGTSGRSSVSVILGSSRNAGASIRIFNFLKLTNELENVINSQRFKTICKRSKMIFG